MKWKALQSTNIFVKDAETIVLKRNGTVVDFENGDLLEIDGKYTITATNADGVTERNFIIDNVGPIVEGIETTVIRETITIRFMNFDDVVSAILTTKNGDIDLYALANEGKLEQDENGRYIYTIEYTEENKGQYYLEVKDAAGNETYRNFRIR